MSTIEILFLAFTIPGIYITIMLGVYKLYRNIVFKDSDDIEDARVAAGFWIVTVPFFLVFGGGYLILHTLFDIMDGGKDK